MPTFQFKATTEGGKTVNGVVEAADKIAAGVLLQENNYSVVSLKLKSNFGQNWRNFSFRKIKNKEVVIFARQFSVMISANVSLVQALDVLSKQSSDPRFQTIIKDLAAEVDGGARFSDALAKYPEVFSDFFVSVIRSGETSGKLDEVLNYLADEMEKDYDMMSKVKGAMTYPIIIFCLLFLVGSLMMIYVIPQLTAVFSETGAALPWPTRLLIITSSLFQNYWWALLVLIIAGSLVLRQYSKTPLGKRQIDIIKINLPIFGHLFRLIYLVRFTRSMNTLIVGGVSISSALEVAAEVSGNEIYRELVLKTLKEVESGNSISSVFSQSREIPPMVSEMLVIGEKTGKLDLVLEKVTDFYTREINGIIGNLMTLIEPVIIVIMGVAVGGIVAAVIMPMYNLASQF